MIGLFHGTYEEADELLEYLNTHDDSRLLQGATTQPPPLACVADFPVEKCCAVSWVGWAGEHLETVGEVEAYFMAACIACDQRLDESAACRWFLNWFDDTPRKEMVPQLLAEVEAALAADAA